MYGGWTERNIEWGWRSQFTGDNPSSLVGVGASAAGTAAISLGTSDTFFCANNRYAAEENSHVFANPSGGYMNLICFRNGSLARERLIKDFGLDWNFFDNKSFADYSPKLDGKYILPFYSDEISPKLKSDGLKFINVDKNNALEVARMFIEGQIMNMKACSDKIDFRPEVVILTGGASKSASMARCVADVFSAPVYAIENASNSAALGAALRAAECFGKSAQTLREKFCKRRLICEPNPENAKIYALKTREFAKLIEEIFPRG